MVAFERALGANGGLTASASKTLSMLVRAASYGFIRPTLPSPAVTPPTRLGWIHEIKHDGYRLMVRRDAAGVRLLTRNGSLPGRAPE